MQEIAPNLHLQNVSAHIVTARPPRILRTPLPDKRNSKRPSHSVLASEQKEDRCRYSRTCIKHCPKAQPSNDVKGAHEADLKTQERYSVAYLRYWVDESQGKVFCLVDAPNAEAASAVHRETHGLAADEIYAVREGS